MNKILQHLNKDKTLNKVIATISLLENTNKRDLYFDLMRSIVSQQLSVKAADTIFNRFLDLFEHRYPQPNLVLSFDISTLRAVGLSNQKANYLQNVATFAQKEAWETKNWDEMTNDELLIYLTKIKGVGKWTVEMILMFTLQRPDVFPADDLGIQTAMKKLYGLTSSGKQLKLEMHEIAAFWQPYRTTACLYLWRWKDA